ncbi:DUF2076 family protein [Xanthobacter sp. TB0139]|uniref:DUF2076 family protein n=1 Tax=Xanthobacter sp. TB0139 TaxID=3459178 RepID=UPI004039921C
MTPEERALIDGLFERIRSVESQQQDPEAQDLISRRVAESPVAAYALVQSVLVQDHALQQAMTRVQELESRLEQAEARILAAEEQAREAAQQPAAGGFLGGLLGGGRSSVPNAGTRASGPASAMAARAPAPGNTSGKAPMGTPPGFGQRNAADAQRQASGPWGQQGAQQGGPAYGQQPQRGGMMGGGGGGFMQNALATAAGVAGGALLFSGIQSMLSGGEGPVAQQAAAETGAADTPAAADASVADASAADTGGVEATPAVDHAMDDGGWNAAPQEASHDGGGWDDSSQWDDGGFDDGGFDDGGWA